MESTALSAESRQGQIAGGAGFPQHDERAGGEVTLDSLRKSISRFERWLSATGYPSYDPYDIWGTGYGLTARRLYYKKHPLGMPMVAPLLLMEILCPSLRRVFVKRSRFATADAQLVLAFLNLAGSSNKETYLQEARQLAGELLEYSIPGFHGYCWGYPFAWRWNGGVWEKNVPFITATPYCFEAFARLYDFTHDPHHMEVARSAAEFVYQDIRDTPTATDAAAGSYSPFDNGKVFNASSYRAFVLLEADGRWNLPHYHEKAIANVNFIVRNQRSDGAWLYALDNPAEAFIDHFHTCFVLKNLVKINFYLKDPAIRTAIHRGFAYYRKELFDAEENPKSFSITPRTQVTRLEMYNFAEAITLGVLLEKEIPEAFELAKRLAAKLVSKYQCADGHFVTRVFVGGRRHTFPFLRWPQAQLFYALTNLWRAMEARPRRQVSISPN